MKRITLSLAFLIFLLSFTPVKGLYQEKYTISSRGMVANSASNLYTGETMFNGVWTWRTYINADMLKDLVSHQIFNVFVNVGYPNPSDDSRLTGIVPKEEIGIWFSQQEVTSLKQLFASVDSRLKLWAWFGTWSSLGTDDYSGHYYAKVDLSTRYNRQVIIENIVEVASWGFYGVQDDTEDYTSNTTPQNRIDFWNEEAIALHQIGVKLATFTYSGPPSLWWVKKYVSQLKVDYIILAPDMRQSQEVIDIHGPIETIWKTEVSTGLSVAQSPCLINTPSAAGSGVKELSLDVLLDLQSEINVTSYPVYKGHTIYCYRNELSITNSEWAAWDNYLSNLRD